MRLWNSLSISHADLGEALSKSTTVIHPLLPVGRQPKRKVFCKSSSDFSRQFNNFFLRKKKKKSSSICFPSKHFCPMIEMTWFLDCSLQEEKPDGRQLSLSSGNYNKVIKPQVNGSSLNICRYKSYTVGKWPKGKCLLIHFPPKLSVTNEHHLI